MQSRRAVWVSGLAAGLGLMCCSLTACIPEVVNSAFVAADLKPASLLSWSAVGAQLIEIEFDEAVQGEALDFTLTRQAGEADLADAGIILVRALPDRPAVLQVQTRAVLEPGTFFALRGQAADAAGNLTSFSVPVWGYNANPAFILINEILSVGSATRPDAVEFYVHTAGNLAGLSFFVGVKDDNDGRYVFPPCEVAAGELLVLHLKPQGLAVELDEIGDIGASGGIDATPTARDFWYPGSITLPGKNGALSVYDNPQGSMREAVIYCERTSESDTAYRGFGTAKLLRRVDAIVAAGMWRIAGSQARPEDAAWSGAVTSTRTLGRSSQSSDTDHASDWHIVPTRGSTIGASNNDTVYQP